MIERRKSPVEIHHRLSVARAAHGFHTGISRVRNSLFPTFPLIRVVGKFVQVIVRSILRYLLKRFHNACVQKNPSIMEKSAIGHLSGKSMLEGVLHVRKKIGLVEKLSSLKRGQMLIQFVLRQPRYSAKQTEGNHRTNNGGGLQQMFFLDV